MSSCSSAAPAWNAAGDDTLNPASSGDSTTEGFIHNKLPQGHFAEFDLIDTGFVHMTTQAEQTGTGAFSVPILLYHSPPLVMMEGTADSVSTLLIMVGERYNPSMAGNGGLLRG